MNKHLHIPAIVAILLMLVGLFGLFFVAENGVTLFTQASGSVVPKDVKISNVADTAATITWVTDKATRTTLQYKKRGLLTIETTAYDTRDSGGDPQPRRVHSVAVINLEPKTSYEFTILSGSKRYKNGAYAVSTGPTLSTPTQVIDPAFGSLVDAKNVPIPEAVVYASFEGSQTVSSLVDNGSWTVPLGQVRSNDGNRYFTPDKTDGETLLFINPDGASTVKTTIANDSPLPPVRLGESYDFSNKETRVRTAIVAQAAGTTTSQGSVTASFQITSPPNDSAIPSFKPLFKGTATANQYVILTISSKDAAPLTTKTTADKIGLWSWTPSTDLAPGKYTVTAASFSTNNKPLATTNSFTILKSGTQVLGDATPSASVRPSPSLIPSASPIVQPTPSLIPSPSASSSALPVTGNTEPTVMVTLFSIACLILGAGMLIATAKR
jgi:hypothetical protein